MQCACTTPFLRLSPRRCVAQTASRSLSRDLGCLQLPAQRDLRRVLHQHKERFTRNCAKNLLNPHATVRGSRDDRTSSPGQIGAISIRRARQRGSALSTISSSSFARRTTSGQRVTVSPTAALDTDRYIGGKSHGTANVSLTRQQQSGVPWYPCFVPVFFLLFSSLFSFFPRRLFLVCGRTATSSSEWSGSVHRTGNKKGSRMTASWQRVDSERNPTPRVCAHAHTLLAVRQRREQTNNRERCSWIIVFVVAPLPEIYLEVRRLCVKNLRRVRNIQQLQAYPEEVCRLLLALFGPVARF